MSALIKAAGATAGDSIRTFAPRTSEPAVHQVPTHEAVLEERIAQLEEMITANEEGHRQALKRARKDGERLALERRSDSEERALRILRDAVADANSAWKQRLSAWETVAVGIAREVLQKTFEDASQRSLLVESCIKRTIGRLDKASLVRFRVSPTDFPEGAVLSPGEGIEVVGDDALGPGECIVDLRLGEIDLGLYAQWARIGQLLDTLEREAAEC
jgi:flagellar biosynthesis/type III secretory pathway protein FliH